MRGLDGVGALPVPLDITDQASVELALQTIEERKGRLDILVNNAAARPDRTGRRRAPIWTRPRG